MVEHPSIKYCRSIAEEFNSRVNRVRNFVTESNLTSGNANESILRDFLALHSPANFEVGTGFICKLFPNHGESNASRQCDILIFDRARYPLVFSEGSIRFVNPSSVRMVIEVKTNLTKKEIKSSIKNIKSVKQIVSDKDPIKTSNSSENRAFIIFAFKSSKIKKVLEHLYTKMKTVESPHSPTAIILFEEEKLVYQKLPWKNNAKVKYNVIEMKKNDIIAFVFFTFLNSVSHLVTGFYPEDFHDITLRTFMEYFETQNTLIEEDVDFWEIVD